MVLEQVLGLGLPAFVLAGSGNETDFATQPGAETHEILVGHSKLVAWPALGSKIEVWRILMSDPVQAKRKDKHGEERRSKTRWFRSRIARESRPRRLQDDAAEGPVGDLCFG